MLFPGATISVSDAVRELSLKGYEVSGSQIRKLDNLGLISLNKKGGKQREITAGDLKKLEIILNLRFLGMSLESIGKFLGLRDLFAEEDAILSKGGPSLEAGAEEPWEIAELDRKRELHNEALNEIYWKMDNHIRNIKQLENWLKPSIKYQKSE